MTANEFYPSLGSLISLDDIPEQLSFVKDGLENLLEDIFVKDIQTIKPAGSDAIAYSLILEVMKKIRIDIIGDELGVVLNPGFDADHPDQGTDIDLSVSYQLGILKYISSFSLKDFVETGTSIYRTLVSVLGMRPEDLLDDAILFFAGANSVSDYVGLINTHYGLTGGDQVPVPSGSTRAEQMRNLVASLVTNAYFIANRIPITTIIYDVSLHDADEDVILRAVERLFSIRIGSSPVEWLKKLLLPKVNVSSYLTAGLEFSRNILLPMDANNQIPNDPDILATLVFELGELSFSSDGGIGFAENLVATFPTAYPKAQIGNTGLTISITNAHLDLSRSASIPQIEAAGYPPDFVGAFIERATIGLPESFWSMLGSEGTRAEIVGRNLIVGTGGVSGTIGLEAVTTGGTTYSIIETSFGGADGFTVKLTRFDITLYQGAITGTDIQGTIVVNGWHRSNGDPVEIPVAITVDQNGFNIKAAVTGLNEELTIPNILTFTVSSLFVGKEDDRYYIGCAGTLEVTAVIPVLEQRFIEQKLEIHKLVIWSNGQFDFEGGSLVLPKIAPLKAGPVELSVTAIHFGRHRQFFDGSEREYKFIGFDGGVNTGIGGVDARGEGIKYYFTVDDAQHGGTHDRFLRIETIRVDLTIPGDATPETAALLLKGYVSMKNPTEDSDNPGHVNESALTEYAGGVSFALPKLDLAGGADLRLIPSIGAFLVDAHLELPTPILLGSTGLGIYGFRGTFGQDYVLQKQDNESWWEFYKKPVQGIHNDKFTQDDGVSIGAGVSLATAFDSGTTFSSKLFFLLSIPEVFMLEGQAAVLSRRIGLDTTDDPPFVVSLAISSSLVQAGIKAQFRIPDSGDVLSVDATMDLAFYFGNAAGWHIYVGEDQPDSKRVQASLLRILKGWTYLMLSSSGIKFGAGVDWKFEQDCGIAKVGLGASLEVGARMSFHPMQVGGWIHLGGYAALRLFGIGFRLTVSASLSAEAPEPFVIAGSFALSLSTPWPLPDVTIRVSLSWHFNDHVDRKEIRALDAKHYASSSDYGNDPKQPVKAVSMLTGESFQLNYVNASDTPQDYPPPMLTAPGIPPVGDGQWIDPAFDDFVVPVDSFIDLEFIKGVLPDPSIARLGPVQTGVVWQELIPPQKGISPQVSHGYRVENVTIKYWSPATGSWEDYDMVDANTPLIETVAMQHPDYVDDHATAFGWAQARVRPRLYYGLWQLSDADRYTKLRLLARTPITGNPHVKVHEMGLPPTALLCPPPERPMVCLDWESITAGTIYPASQKLFDRKLSYQITDSDGTVAAIAGPFGLTHALRLQQDNRLELFFAEPMTKVVLRVTTLAAKVSISYYLGYASDAAPARLSPTGGTIDRWDVAPARDAGAVTSDGTWQKLRAMPSFVRAFCSGTAPDENFAPIAALKKIMTTKFARTNYFLRQAMGLPKPAVGATFCDGLREMLETVIAALTGTYHVPAYLKPNVEYFYLDAKRYALDYVTRLKEAGSTIPEPDQESNEFYERWLDLIACLGAVCENRGSLPEYIGSYITGIVDPEVAKLESAVRTLAAGASITLNQPSTITDPLQRLKLAAEFFATLSLRLDAISIPHATVTQLDPYYDRLDALARTLRAALVATGDASCTGAADGSIPTGSSSGSSGDLGAGCGRMRELTDITTLLCVGAGPIRNAATDGIDTLLTGFASTVTDLETYFGWSTSSPGADTCAELRRALAVVIVAYSAFDELPSLYRLRVRDFYGRLAGLADDYRTLTQDEELPEPDGMLAAFVHQWQGALVCLCNFCAGMSTLSPGELAFFASDIDPVIDALALEIAADAVSGGSPLSGTEVSTDRCRQIATMVNILSALEIGCAGVLPDVQSWLTDELTALQSDYNSFVSGALSSYNSVICGGSTPPCSPYLAILDCLSRLCARRAFLPAEIVTQIETDFADTLLAVANAVYNVYTDLAVWPDFPEVIGAIEFEVNYILGHFYADCLTGQPINSAVTAQVPSELADLVTAFSSLETALEALPEGETITLCGSSTPAPCARQKGLLANYRKLCNTPPTTPQLQSAPLSGLVTLLHDSADLFGRITGLLGLMPIPTGWTEDDFCAVVAQVTNTLVIAYSSLDRMSLALESELNGFCDAMQGYVDAWSGSTAPSGTCQTTVESWLEIFRCLCAVCRYRPFLPASVFDTGGLEAALGPRVETLYRKALQWADMMGLQVLPDGSPVGRCRKLRVISNYFGLNALDYTSVAAIKDQFDARGSLLTALDDPAIAGARGTLCPVPGSGPYDPLKKRVVRSTVELLDEIIYDDGANPIDRIVITPSPGCDAGTATDWSAVLGELATLIGSGSTPQERKDRLTTFRDAIQGGDFAGEACRTFVHQICWLPQADHEYNNDLPDPEVVRDVTNNIIFNLKELTQPIWRPKTKYAVQVETSETIDNDAGSVYRRWYTFGFTTGGPVGHFHEIGQSDPPTYRDDYEALLQADREAEYQYANLKHYIDYERSYPNPDGNIIGAKPLYYQRTRLSLFYLYDYVNSMYSQWSSYGGLDVIHSGLQIVIRDPGKQADPDTGADTDITIDPIWRRDEAPRKEKDVEVFRYMVANREEDCLEIDPLLDSDQPPAQQTVIPTPPDLKPKKLYAAMFNAVLQEGSADTYRRLVHQYVFQTSRYPDFQTHIESYLLDAASTPQKKAIYTVAVEDAARVTMASAVISGVAPTDPDEKAVFDGLQIQYASLYERLIDGALRLSGLGEPATTEFTAITQGSTVIGLLVRSPEPLNDPRLPADQLLAGLGLSGLGSTPTVIFSKDAARVFVSTAGLSIAGDTTVSFDFTYILFDGKAYGPAKTLTSSVNGNGNTVWSDQPVPAVTVQIEI